VETSALHYRGTHSIHYGGAGSRPDEKDIVNVNHRMGLGQIWSFQQLNPLCVIANKKLTLGLSFRVQDHMDLRSF